MIKETYTPLLAEVVFEGEAVSPPKQIPWYVRVFISALDLSRHDAAGTRTALPGSSTSPRKCSGNPLNSKSSITF